MDYTVSLSQRCLTAWKHRGGATPVLILTEVLCAWIRAFQPRSIALAWLWRWNLKLRGGTREKNCWAVFLILSSVLRFPCISDSSVSFTEVSIDPVILRCLHLFSSSVPFLLFQLKESGQFCKPCSCTFNKGIRKPLVLVITCNFCTSLRI